MAGRAQRIIWFLLLSPCRLPSSHFVNWMKIVRPLCFLRNHRHYHRHSFFRQLLHFPQSRTQTTTDNISRKTSDSEAHIVFCILVLRSGGCCKSVATTRNWLWQTAQPGPCKLLPCQPYRMLAHLVMAPRWQTIWCHPPLTLVLRGLVNEIWRKHTHI